MPTKRHHRWGNHLILKDQLDKARILAKEGICLSLILSLSLLLILTLLVEEEIVNLSGLLLHFGVELLSFLGFLVGDGESVESHLAEVVEHTFDLLDILLDLKSLYEIFLNLLIQLKQLHVLLLLLHLLQGPPAQLLQHLIIYDLLLALNHLIFLTFFTFLLFKFF